MATSELDKINKKKNHITHTRHHPQKQAASCEMLASTIQFSHNTPTSNKHHHNKRCSSTSQAHKKGDNAPDTQQCTNVQSTLIFAYMDTFTHVTKHHSNTRSCRLRCMSYPEFPCSVAAEHSPTQPPTHHQTTVGNPQLWVMAATAAKIKAP